MIAARRDHAGSAVRRVVGRPLALCPDGALRAGEPVVLRIAGSRIASIEPAAPGAALSADAIGDRDAVLAPALTDAHVHLVATAARRAGIDLVGEPPRRLADLLARLEIAATSLRGDGDPPSSWVRVSGFDEARLAEGRAPTLAELDRAVPRRALRLRHATRHASFLNSAAFAAVERSLGPLGDRVPRDAAGRPVGVVYGLERELTALVGPPPADVVRAGLRAASRELARGGVATIDEVTGSNDAERVALLAAAVERGDVVQRVRAFVGDADAAADAWHAAGGRVEIAGVKLFAHDAEEAATPAFHAALARARGAGLPVAVHAVEADAVQAVLEALAAAPPRARTRSAPGRGRSGDDRVANVDAVPDRIEHAALCPPELARRIAAAGVAVVAQPGFLEARGDKYRREVEEVLWPWLVALRTLREHGVLVAAGSDSPVGPLDPRAGLRGATGRRSACGVVLGAVERLSPAEAVALYARAPARLRGESGAAAWAAVGERADVALLEQAPPGASSRGWGSWSWDWWRAGALLVGGELLWSGGAPQRGAGSAGAGTPR